MTRFLIAIIFITSIYTTAFTQVNVRDSAVFAPLVSVAYAVQIPKGDMSKQFGVNSAIGGSFLIKDKKNFVYGFSGDFLFGNQLKDETFLVTVATSKGAVVNQDGVYADVRLFERGYSFLLHFGKQFSILSLNNNSGPYVLFNVGMLQYKLKIDVINNDVPQLRDQYLHGYDRLTNGMAIGETIGYRYLGNYRLTNFFVEVEFLQASTKNRRSYNIDIGGTDNTQRLDFLTGFRFGWSVPLYKKTPREYYFY